MKWNAFDFLSLSCFILIKWSKKLNPLLKIRICLLECSSKCIAWNLNKIDFIIFQADKTIRIWALKSRISLNKQIHFMVLGLFLCLISVDVVCFDSYLSFTDCKDLKVCATSSETRKRILLICPKCYPSQNWPFKSIKLDVAVWIYEVTFIHCIFLYTWDSCTVVDIF